MYLYLTRNHIFKCFIIVCYQICPWGSIKYFLPCQTLDTTDDEDVVGNVQLEILPPESVESGIRLALGAFREGLHDLCKGSLASIFRVGESLSNTACFFFFFRTPLQIWRHESAGIWVEKKKSYVRRNRQRLAKQLCIKDFGRARILISWIFSLFNILTYSIWLFFNEG